MYDIDKLVKNSEDVKKYIESSHEKVPQFIERYNSYELDKEMMIKISCHSDKYMIFAFSAEWCPDCYQHIPVLAKLAEETGLEARVFGHLMRDAKSPDKLWRIPPSPKEVEEFQLVKIPSMYILNEKGEKIGEIIEHPAEGKKLEEEILEILES